MATTKITNPELFDLGSLNTALKLPSGTTAERPASPSTGEWRYNTDNNLIEFYDGVSWRDLQDEDIPPIASEHFNTVIYTGNGTSQSITGLGFQPDFLWIKCRDVTYGHTITDSTRGNTKQIYPDSTSAQTTNSTMVSSFDTDGFSVANNAYVNNGNLNYVAWCLKGGGNSNTYNVNGVGYATRSAAGLNNGTIPDANFLGASVNSKAGFSIQHINGSGVSGGSTIDTGLTQQAELLIIKRLDSTGNWVIPQDATDQYLLLNTTAAGVNITFTNYVSGTNNILYDFYEYVCYSFHSVAGFSKIGSYTGNGSTNGPIINTGFESAFLMIKRTDSGDNWLIFDNKRNPLNTRNLALIPNSNAVESVGNLGNGFNFLSNGFQVVSSDSGINANGGTYIYMTFAADPSDAPVLADSFDVSLWTGDGNTNRAIQGLGFQPAFVWLKSRSSASWNHFLQDQIRTAPYFVGSQSTGAEITTSPNIVSSFDSDGFTIQNNGNSNNPGDTWVSWSWKANSVPTINTDGTIQSLVSANPAAGFSIVKYTGNGTQPSSIGHGLSSAPEIVINKSLSQVVNWHVYTSSTGATSSLVLNDTAAAYTGVTEWNTAPDSTKIYVGNTNTNQSGSNYISYCFHSVSGFSKIGSYAGTSSTNSITGLGFQPDYVMIKSTDYSNSSWLIYDSARSATPLPYLLANTGSAEASTTAITITLDSDGFTIPSTAATRADLNLSGYNYIFMAFKINKTEADLNYLVVAGGASGGRTNAGGGGAGGLRTSYGSSSGGGSTAESGLSLTAGTYTITVGAGGAAPASQGFGNNGSSSSLAGPGITTITSIGGGYGYGMIYPGINKAGDGGSGGGAGTNNNNQPATKGFGTTAQGFDGGARFATVNTYAGGGGGGASQVGQASTSQEDGGDGGNGLAVSITGSSVSYAGGGGGGGNTTAGAGGLGGGTAGGLASGTVSNATANTGGASGGTRNNVAGGSGGSGVVILRMPTASYSGTTTGSPTVTTDGSDTILTYTGSGTYVHS